MRNREPRYRDVVYYIEDCIKNGELKVGDKLPSVNSFKIRFGISRSSVFLAMDELKAHGLIESEPAVGYFVSGTRIEIKEKILLLFNEFNSFKEDLYNSFVTAMGENATIDIMFHNFNREVLETLLMGANGKYTSYIVMPGAFRGLAPLLHSMKGRVFLLDHFADDIAGEFPSVGQNFENDLYGALVQGLPKLKKYDTMVLIQHQEKEPAERFRGMSRFCVEYGLRCRQIPTVMGRMISKGEVFLTPEDKEIVYLLRLAKSQGFELGKDFGIISFNETLIKEVLSGGITTISTDFVMMGKTLASLVKEGRFMSVHNPCHLTIRESL